MASSSPALRAQRSTWARWRWRSAQDYPLGSKPC